MKRLILSVLLLTAASTLAAPAPFPKAKRDGGLGAGLRELQGERAVLARLQRDVSALDRKADAHGAAIEGNRIRWLGRGRGGIGLVESIRLHPAASPRGI